MRPLPVVIKRPRVEMVPLIDMFFLLLVFFMFGVFYLNAQHGIVVELPKTATAESIADPATVTISVTADHQLFVNREPVTLEGLAAALAPRRLSAAQTTVLINADRLARHGFMLELLDRVRIEGFHRVTFQSSTEPQP